jgi:Arc/MetJ family transcription regulator
VAPSSSAFFCLPARLPERLAGASPGTLSRQIGQRSMKRLWRQNLGTRASLGPSRTGALRRERRGVRGPHVYNRCMSTVRTNIEIEDSYVRAIMDRYGVRTKTAAVDLALRHLAGQPMTLDEARAMRGAHALSELPADVPPAAAA